MKQTKRQMTPVRIITLGFLCVVLVGALLLTLPAATRSGESTHFVDALFTSTSASCVTGLVVYDTYAHWSLFGQIVILSLIQVGGIGIVTLAMYFLSFAHAKIGVRNVFALQESIGAPSPRGLVRMTRFIAMGVFLIEAAGAVLLLPAFIPEFGVAKGIYYSVFHSISAFCNAGFDLMGAKGEFCSLVPYSADAYVNIIVMLLIAVGGLGFFVWRDIRQNGFAFRRYALHTKIVLIATAILIFGGALLFFILSSDSAAMTEKSLPQKILASFFQSVTARTAGFATVDLSAIGGGAQMLMICLMFVGGSPGSTAGGIKTATAAVIFLFVRSVFRKREDVECFGRRIGKSVIRTATAVFVLYLFLALSAGIAISAIENVNITDALFETFSAIATVGLSLSLTPSLGTVSKIIVSLLMFIGRVGGLTVFLSLSGAKAAAGRFPEENVTVG